MRRHGAVHQPAPVDVPWLNQVAAMDRLSVPTHGSWFLARPPSGVANAADDDPLLNDTLGCCVPAADWRWIQAVLAADGAWLKIDPAWVKARYEMTGDYVDGNPATDQGTVTCRDMFSWLSAPIVIPTTDQLIQINWTTIVPTAGNEISKALGQTPLLATFNLPASRADDLRAWGVAPDHEPGTVGHRIMIGAWDGAERVARSWGEDAIIHPDFWNAYCVEVDAPIPAKGVVNYDFAGLDYDALTVAMSKLSSVG